MPTHLGDISAFIYPSDGGGGFPVKRRGLVQRQETNDCYRCCRRRLDTTNRGRLQMDR